MADAILCGILKIRRSSLSFCLALCALTGFGCTTTGSTQNDNTKEERPIVSELSSKSSGRMAETTVQAAGGHPPAYAVGSAPEDALKPSPSQGIELPTETASSSRVVAGSEGANQDVGTASNSVYAEDKFSPPLAGIIKADPLVGSDNQLAEPSHPSGSEQPEEVPLRPFAKGKSSAQPSFSLPGIGSFSPTEESLSAMNSHQEVLPKKSMGSDRESNLTREKNFPELLRDIELDRRKGNRSFGSRLLREARPHRDFAEQLASARSNDQQQTGKVASPTMNSAEISGAAGQLGGNDSPIRNSLKEIDLLVKDLPLGNIAFNVPDRMNLDESTELALTLSLTTSLDDLKKSVLLPRIKGTIETAAIRVTDRMEARLTGNGFQITAITPELQAIIPSEATTWKWLIKAAHPGTQELHLTVSALVEINKSTTPFVSRTFDKTITVEVTWQKKVAGFTQENWQWIWGAVAAPVGAWFFNRYRKSRSRQRDIED